MADVTVNLRQHEIDALANDPDTIRMLMERAAPIVREAQAHAPRLTGAGGDSIRADKDRDAEGTTVHITWEREFYYMYFHERGTRLLPARPFLVPTLEGLR